MSGRGQVDAARFPCVAEYLAGLPEGLDSHPDCLAKASLYRSLLDGRSLRGADVATLPDPMRKLIEDPPPISTWIPEVHSHSVMLAVCDLCFADVDAFARYAYVTQRRLFEGRLYRALFRFAAPPMLLRGAALRWGGFHRGSQLLVESMQAERATIRLRHPPHLYDAISRRGLREGLRAILGLTRATNAAIEELDASPTGARVQVSWCTSAARDA
jgi:hypothetical protein